MSAPASASSSTVRRPVDGLVEPVVEQGGPGPDHAHVGGPDDVPETFGQGLGLLRTRQSARGVAAGQERHALVDQAARQAVLVAEGPVSRRGTAVGDPARDADRCRRQWQDEFAQRRREFAGLAAYVTAPPERFVPGDLVGRRVLAVVPAFMGDPVIGASFARPLRVKARPLVDQARPLAYVEQQSLFDRHVPHDLRCETSEVSALTPELLRHFEDTSTALRVLVPNQSGWTVHEGELVHGSRTLT